jgi:3D (Asp-Asp-Asp) domain-containing protein
LLNSNLFRGRLLAFKQLAINSCWPALPLKALGLLALLVLLLGTVAARTASRKAARTSAVYTVTATAYGAVTGQTDSKPFLTADNSRIPRHYGSHTRWLALSRDLLHPWGGPFAFGDKVRVTGISPALDGVYTIHDTMNRRYRHRLDVLAHPRERISLNRPGVKLQRISGATQASRPRPRAAEKVVAKAPRRKIQSHRAPAKAVAVKPQRKPTKRPASLAHQKHGVAKKQLAALPKRPKQRVVAQVHHLAAPQVLRAEHKRVGKLRASQTTRKARRVAVLFDDAHVPAALRQELVA